MATKDPELDAMARVSEALDALEPEVRERVLRWAAERHGVALSTGRGKQNAAGGTDDQDGEGEEQREFADLGDLVSAAAPSNDQDRALVVAYWFQEHENQKTVNTQQVNTQLKNLGHGVARVGDVFGRLVATSPQQVIQTRKAGTSRQARKEYKVTKIGKDRVAALIAGTADQP